MYLRAKEFLLRAKEFLQISADEAGDIALRLALLALFTVVLPKALYMVSKYHIGVMLAVYAVFFSLCYVVVYRKEKLLLSLLTVKSKAIANMIPEKEKKTGIHH